MTLTIDQLQQHIAGRFSDVERIADSSVIRFTRKTRGRPFAVYYVDIDPALPSTKEELAAYQDRVIGGHYFDGNKSLQWSNYLYFVVSDSTANSSKVRSAKDLIEKDRTYARKYVITETDLDAAIDPPAIQPSDSLPKVGILSTWMNILAAANLDHVILSDESLPARLAIIETGLQRAPQQITVATPTAPGKPESYLRSLELKEFRAFPSRRTFDFGNVNLICGVNGSGKTSLLEAIELLYCGKTNRYPADSPAYAIIATYADDHTDNATDARPLSVFRERNLRWYGQAEIKTSNLYLSFAQFNFLNTDAAVRLAESESNIEEELAKLLVGSQTSKVEREIERTNEKVSDKLRALTELRKQIETDLVSLDTQLTDVANVKIESDSIFTRLDEMLHQVGWQLPPNKKKDEYVSTLVESLVELEPIAQQAAALDWAGAPVSLHKLRRFAKDAASRSEAAGASLAKLEATKVNESRLADEVKRCQKQVKCATELARMADAGVPLRMDECRTLQRTFTNHGVLLAGYDATLLSITAHLSADVTVEEFVGSTQAEGATAEQDYAAMEADYAKFTETRDQVVRLAAELRNIAARLVQKGANPDACPLCHSQFGPGELEKHIQLGIDGDRETQSQALLSRLQHSESRLRAARNAENAANWLKGFCARANVPMAATVHAALLSVGTIQRQLEEGERSYKSVMKELDSLGARGLSAERYDDLVAELSENGLALANLTKEAIDIVCAELDEELKDARGKVESEREKSDELLRTIKESLLVGDSGIDSLQAAVSQLRERRAVADRFDHKISIAFEVLSWPHDRPLVELLIEIESIRKTAGNYQATVAQERNAKTIVASSTKRKSDLEAQLAELAPRITRLAYAKAVFDEIQNKHPLEGAMDAALKQNRAAIEAIFRRIHAPAEFSGLGSDVRTLVRKNDGTEANLRQISTGQALHSAVPVSRPEFTASNGSAGAFDRRSNRTRRRLELLILSGLPAGASRGRETANLLCYGQ